MSETQAPPVEKTTEPAEKATESKTYKQEDVDSLLDKVRKTEEVKRTKLVAELEERRKAAMTEDERKIQAARDEGAKEANAKLKMTETLLEAGVSNKRLRHAMALAKEFVGPDADAEEVVNVLKRESPELFATGHKFGPSDGQNAGKTSAPAEWTAERVEAELEKLNPTQQREWWVAHEKEVLDYQNRTRPFRTIAPGVKGF